MHRTNYLVIFLLFCLSIVGGAKLLAQNALQKVSLQLKWWHQFQFAGFYAAQQKGFYKEVGLDVSLFESSAANPPLNAVLTNKADFGVVGADLVVNYAKGDPVKVIGAIFQHSPYALLSLPSQKINAPNNLMGKTIMGSPDQGWVQILAMLLAEGIDTTSIKRIDHSWKNEDLINGKTDLITGYSCVEPYQIKKAFGIDVNLLQPINYGIDFYGDVLFCHANLAETNPDLVEKFKKASFKGWEYAMSHKQEIAEYILTLPGVKQRGITIEHLLFEANSMNDLLLPKLVEPGHMNEGRWNHIAGIYKKLNIIPADADISNFIFKEREVSNTETLKKTFIALGCIVFLALVLFAFNIHLSKSVKRRTQELENEIKQRKFTEENLKLSEERLALATKAAGIGIWDW
ncbi:MAG: ABC transporter substrate-binding protein, partial [Chitinophagaceae bacterium]